MIDIKLLKRYQKNKMFSIYSDQAHWISKDEILIPLYIKQNNKDCYYYKAFKVVNNRIIEETTKNLKVNIKHYKVNNVGLAFKTFNKNEIKILLERGLFND